jgi:hypothetical protein
LNGGFAYDDQMTRGQTSRAPRYRGSPLDWAAVESFLATFDEYEKGVMTRGRSWAAAAAFNSAHERLKQISAKLLGDERAWWNEKLTDLGGDPSSRDWRGFRPLRLSREEDWSDWLAHLIASSETGSFSRRLFARAMGALPDDFDWTGPEVKREWTLDTRRADIGVLWRTPASGTARGTSVEVKVGDLGLEKTYETARQIETRRRERLWAHVLLLPEQDVVRWDELEDEHGEVDISVITWTDVAIALRRSLLDTDEPLLWRVWAMAFGGVVEQRLVGIRWPRPIDPIAALEFLRRGRPDEAP